MVVGSSPTGVVVEPEMCVETFSNPNCATLKQSPWTKFFKGTWTWAMEEILRPCQTQTQNCKTEEWRGIQIQSLKLRWRHKEGENTGPLLAKQVEFSGTYCKCHGRDRYLC